MMRIVEVAQAVTDALNSAGFLPVVAVRAWAPVVKLEELETAIFVIPQIVESAPTSRKKTQDTYTVQVGVIGKIPVPADGNETEIDELSDTVQQINDFLGSETARNMAGAVWTGCVIDPVFVQEHLNERRQFTSVVSATYLQIGE